MGKDHGSDSSRGLGGRVYITLGSSEVTQLNEVSFEIPGANKAQSSGMTPFKTLVSGNEAGNIQDGMGQ